MPVNHNIRIIINGQIADLPDTKSLNLQINYALEDPDNFENKMASMAFNVELPSTGVNDKIFNTYYNAKVQDLTPDGTYSNWMPCQVIVNGTEILGS